MKTIGLIPARGGSKGVPNKNIREIYGKPLIAWTLSEAQKSKQLTKIVVSTDSPEIAEVSKKFGGEVPFLRPKELAQDNSPSIDTVLHALTWFRENEKSEFDYVCLLQPTSPLRSGKDIDAAIELVAQRKAEAVISLTPVTQHPYLMRKINQQQKMEPFISVDPSLKRRQDYPVVYTINGAIYITRRDILIEKKDFYTENTYAYLMPPERSLDIDTPLDFHFAEFLLQNREKKLL